VTNGSVLIEYSDGCAHSGRNVESKNEKEF
jgi:hypothetical protein